MDISVSQDPPYDYSGSQESADIGPVRELCRNLIILQAKETELQEQLAKIQAGIKKLASSLIPNEMTRLGITGISLGNLSVDVETTIHASLPSAKNPFERERALDMLRKTGNSGAIKATFRVNFAKDSTQEIARFRQLLANNDIDSKAKVVVTETVHHSTYSKIVRELADEDLDLDLQLVGGYRQQQAVVTLPTKKRK